MFNFSIDDQKKYEKGDFVRDVKISNYIDEPSGPLVQHLAVIYGEALHIALQFDIDEKEMNVLAFEYLDECYPEDVKKLIFERMKHGHYQYNVTDLSKEEV